MKKIISIAIIFMILLMQFANIVYADGSCSINLSSNKSTVNSGDTIELKLKMSNITIEGGVNAFYSIMDLSEDSFELVIDESEEAEAILNEFEGTEYEGCQILYIGQTDTDEEILNPWMLLLLEAEGQKGIIGITTEPQKEAGTIGKISLKVKEDAQSGSSQKITLKELTVVDADENSTTLSNAETTVKIGGSQQISIGSVDSNTSNTSNTNKATNTSTYNKVNTTNKITTANEDVPEAGSPIILPILLVLIGIIIFKYKKYKDFKNI